MPRFRIVDLGNGFKSEGLVVQGATIEKAARDVLGVSVVRSGRTKDLRAIGYALDTDSPKVEIGLYLTAFERLRTETETPRKPAS